MFSNRQLALMGMLIAFNVAIGGLVHVIKLPIFLDAIGTIIAAVILRPWAAVVVGVFSFLIAAAIINPVYAWFVGTQAVIAVAVYLAAKYLCIFKSLARAIPAGLVLGVITGIVSAPVIVYVFGGVAGSGRDLLTAAIISTGEQIWRAVFLSGAASEPVDKLLQVLAAFFILHALPRKVLEPFRNPVLERNNLL